MKFDINQAHADRKARIARLAEVRNQITTDQKSNAKRDAKALKAEAAWYAKHAEATK